MRNKIASKSHNRRKALTLTWTANGALNLLNYFLLRSPEEIISTAPDDISEIL